MIEIRSSVDACTELSEFSFKDALVSARVWGRESKTVPQISLDEVIDEFVGYMSFVTGVSESPVSRFSEVVSHHNFVSTVKGLVSSFNGMFCLPNSVDRLQYVGSLTLQEFSSVQLVDVDVT